MRSCDTCLAEEEPQCIEALGMEDMSILNDQITASAWALGAAPRHARLNNIKSYWSVSITDPSEPWIKVDLLSVETVTGMKTQGGWVPGYKPEWVTQLQLQYGETENSMDYIMESGNPKVSFILQINALPVLYLRALVL